MTNNDFHAERTELSNAFAQAGAELLDYMRCAGALAAIPNTQQYVVAGDIAAIRAQLDTVAPQRRMRHGERPEQPLYFGPEAGQARRWAALITSAGHGVLQEYGSKFEHAQPGQEVLEVMEILPGAANKAAEEGELPELRIEVQDGGSGSWPIVVLDSDNDPIARFSYHVDAERFCASRQVANKAEVDLSGLTRFGFEAGGDFVQWDGGNYVCLADVEDILATPPATTGPSSVLRPTDDELWDATLRDRDAYHDWADKLADAIANYFGIDIGEHSNQNLPWDEALQAIENAEPVGASTVLTDERIDEIARPWIGMGGVENQYAFARAIEREVAAQAGQVAVPEDAKRFQWIEKNYGWSTRWRLKKGVEQWQMLDDGEPWGQWGTLRNVIDAAMKASPAKESK